MSLSKVLKHMYLMNPRSCGVDGFSVGLEPGSHLAKSLFEDGDDGAFIEK
jgi:hypothetical protein